MALCYFVALFLDYEKGEGVIWLVVPLLFAPLLVSWFYVVRRFMRALAFRLLPVAAFTLTSGALLVTSVHFDTPPFVLVLPTFLLTATIWAVVTAAFEPSRFRVSSAAGRPKRTTAPAERDFEALHRRGRILSTTGMLRWVEWDALTTSFGRISSG